MIFPTARYTRRFACPPRNFLVGHRLPARDFCDDRINSFPERFHTTIITKPDTRRTSNVGHRMSDLIRNRGLKTRWLKNENYAAWPISWPISVMPPKPTRCVSHGHARHLAPDELRRLFQIGYIAFALGILIVPERRRTSISSTIHMNH